jgi:tetratricopeptide (TPR) repeat protein
MSVKSLKFLHLVIIIFYEQRSNYTRNREMLKFFLQSISVAIFLLPFLIPSVYAKVPDIVSKQRETVVTVYVNDRQGKHIASATGFIVDRRGVIATNCRIVARWFEKIENVLIVETAGGIQFPMGDLISSRCENNLALFTIAGANLTAVRLAKDYKPTRRERIAVAQGTSSPVTEGVIRNVRKGGTLFELSVTILPLKSGSPVFNMKGEAIGAAISLPGKGRKISFAVSLKGIARQLERYEKIASSIKSIPPHPLEQKREEEKPLGPDDYFSRGCAYDKLNLFREATKEYRRSLTLNPNLLEAYMNLGTDYYKVGQYDEAIDTYKEAIKRQPYSAPLYNKLGSLYILERKYPMAIASFKKAISIDPGDADAHFNLGIAYFLNGDSNAAFDECETLEGIDKERSDTLSNILY